MTSATKPAKVINGPKIRAWIHEEVSRALAGLLEDGLSPDVDKILAPRFNKVGRELKKIAEILNHTTLRIETLYRALAISGLLSEEAAQKAHQELVRLRQELHRVMQLEPINRVGALLEWNAKGTEIAMSPVDLELHTWLLQPDPTMGLEDRVSAANSLGFGPSMVDEIRRRFSSNVVSLTPTPESVPT